MAARVPVMLASGEGCGHLHMFKLGGEGGGNKENPAETEAELSSLGLYFSPCGVLWGGCHACPGGSCLSGL